MLRPTSMLIALPLLASVAMAEPADRAAFEPVTTKAGLETVEVPRSNPAKDALANVKAPAVSVQSVDTNGDGAISFAELLVHHKKTDF